MIECFKITKFNNKSLYAHGRYELRYTPGSTVIAMKKTFGIFCFESLDDVYRFDNCLCSNKSKNYLGYKIFKTFGKKEDLIDMSNKSISPSQSEYILDSFYRYSRNHKTSTIPPFGTICFSKILVGEEL